MSFSQQRDELASEIMDLGGRNKDVSLNQLGLDLATGAKPLKKSPADKHQDIIGHIAAR